MRYIVLCLITLSFAVSLFSQTTEDWLWDESESQEEKLEADFIQVNYDKKDARLAMLMSMLIPGAGQFYADRSAITTYIFPAIEIGMIAGYLYFENKGNDKTKIYERYANKEDIVYTLPNGEQITTPRYLRDRQRDVENDLIALNTVDIYERSFFRLDPDDIQHFYEDIGKYSHYVFGWADWYYTFAANEQGEYVSPNWYPEGGNAGDPGWIWEGNYPIYDDPERGFYTNQSVDKADHRSSPMRKTYIDLRNDAKDEFSKAQIFTFGLALNHITAGLDAIRVTRKYNRSAITDSGIRMKYYTSVRNDKLTPILSLNWKF